ncbi:hypothetical protein QVD17_38656 [Tagetes erecta]|uniref:Pentatricopeptide repeat-containing protein n=1 Tax=Tagetes erecta TaxID=13708 RepID=A0AAD8JNV4_TARER|nr:hypothetical protein QVD17_38656 [Tagetes erecta]
MHFNNVSDTSPPQPINKQPPKLVTIKMSTSAKNLTKLLNSVITFSDHTAKNLTRTAGSNVTLQNHVQLNNSSSSSSSSSLSHLKPPTAESIKLGTSTVKEDAVVIPELEPEPLGTISEFSWPSATSNRNAQLKRREVLREKKQTWRLKNSQGTSFQKLLRMYIEKLGAYATIDVFRKLDRETGVQVFNFMIQICIENARNTDDEDVALEEVHRAYMIFETMRELGLEIWEVTYCPFLMFIIDMGMVEEFHIFCEHIKNENPKSRSRLAYYEMLLWIKVGDGGKIQELIINAHANDDSNVNEYYFAALCEASCQDKVSVLLETLNIKNISSKETMELIFKLLGKLLLELHAKKFILELITEDRGHDLSNLIYCYAMNMPNKQTEDIVEKLKNLHAELKVAPSSRSQKKLTLACLRDSLETHDNRRRVIS